MFIHTNHEEVIRLPTEHNGVPQLHVGSVYLPSGKSTAGAILPLGEPSWLIWSCAKDNMLVLAFSLYMT